MKAAAGLLLAVLLVPAAAGQTKELAAKSQRAREAMGAGRFAEAVSLYRELVAALPAVAGLRMNLGIAHFMAGQYAAAAAQLDAALKADPKLSEAMLFLGASRLRGGNPAAAAAPLQAYVQRAAQDPRGRQLLGEAQLALRRHKRAAEQFEALRALEPRNPKTWYGLAAAYEGLAAEAFAALDRLAPESAYWLALIAHTRVAQGQNRSAFFFYRKALEKNPKLRGIHVALSRIYREIGRAEWADEEEQKEVALGLPDCRVEKAVCDFLEGRVADVLAAVEKQQTPESYYWRSQIYNQLALEALSQLAKLPRSFELHEVTAGIHRSRGRHLEAVEEWKRALELEPGNPAARSELAVSLVLARDYDAARPIVEGLLASEPGSPRLNQLAGEIHLNQQRPAEALPFLVKAAMADPGNVPARASLGRAYMAVGDAARAVPHLKAALAADSDGSLHYQLARAYRASGQAALAAAMMDKYQQIQKSLEREKEQLEKEVQITPP